MKFHIVQTRSATNEAFIQLSNTDMAICDIEDLDIVSPFKWFVNQKGYICTSVGEGENRKIIGMHRMILFRHGAEVKGKHVDHINRVRFDNRKSNLRLLTPAENKSRVRKPENIHLPTGISRYKDKRNKRFLATISYEGRTTRCGAFETVEEAVKARKEKAAELYGEAFVAVMQT